MHAPYTFLVVDDDPVGLELTALLLARSFTDAAVHTCSNAPEGLQLLSERPVDLVITDHSMKEMQGLVFVEEVKKRCPGTLIIMHTASHELEDAAAAAGVSAFVPSSETPRLAATVKRLLSGRHNKSAEHGVG